MRAETAALGGIERLFEQCAENRRFDLVPILLRRLVELADFLTAERAGLLASANKLPLNFSTLVRIDAANAPSFMDFQRSVKRGTNLVGSLRQSSSRSRNDSSGRSFTLAANIVNRQRIKNCATSSAGYFFASNAFDTSASRPAISRVALAAVRVGSSDCGASHIAFEAIANFGLAQVFR